MRARAAGFTTLRLNVDTPVAGARLRDVHNGFTIPPTLSIRTLADIALHPSWWFNKLTTDPLRLAVFSETQGTVADLINRVFDRAITNTDLGWLRDEWAAAACNCRPRSACQRRRPTGRGEP